MELEKMTFEKKKELLNISMGVAGVQFNDPNLTELIIKVYQLVDEKGASVPMGELIKIKDEYLKKYPQRNESSGKKPDPK